VLGLLVVALAAATLAPPATTRVAADERTCPPAVVAPFLDVAAGYTHASGIACMAGWGAVRGYGDGTFRPGIPVERAQVASALHRFLDAVGTAPAAGPTRFRDVPPTHTHAATIDALAAAGVVAGLDATTFGPSGPLTRGQVASLLTRTHELVYGRTLPPTTTDLPRDVVGTTHEGSIGPLLQAGIVQGYADGTFRPGATVTRGQLATILAGYAELLVAGGLATAPARSSAPDLAAAGPFRGQRHFGVATASNGWDTDELRQVTSIAGRPPSIVLHYLGFPEELQLQQLRQVGDQHAMSLLTWEPFDWRQDPVDQPAYRLRAITDGRFDDHLTRTARTIQSFDGPVLLRFAHEMNGDWYPWSERVNGNRPGDYVAAWRHVHDLFARLGVDNVWWVWSPNIEYPGAQPLTELYPGARYVDVIALDGYNWGATPGGAGWQSPAQVFGPTLATVRRLAPGTPLMIGETASSEHGGSKAAWNTELFRWLDTQRDVEALVWFHLDKEADWRIDSSPSSADAFAAGLASWLGR
jgi:hypothetical protein